MKNTSFEYLYKRKKISSLFFKDVNGLDMHCLTSGERKNPLILLLHGFPELSFSWRKIIYPLSQAGFYVVAPDQRGFGKTKGGDNNFKSNFRTNNMINLTNDIVSLIFQLGYKKAECVVGHDFGSIVAGWCSIIRPDIFKKVVFMSAPFSGPPSVVNTPGHDTVETFKNITQELKKAVPPRKHYQVYFSKNNANQDMMKSKYGLKRFLRSYFFMKSGDWKDNNTFKLDENNLSEFLKLPNYYVMSFNDDMAETVMKEEPSKTKIKKCKWLTDEDLNFYTSSFQKTSFQGGLQWYRCIIDKRCNEQLKLFCGRKIKNPSMFLAGERDWGVYQFPGIFEKMQNSVCTKMKICKLIKGAGHWIQQEKPKIVTEFLLKFVC